SMLRHADRFFHDGGRRFVLLFDALDRLGTDWKSIRTLTRGVLRLALDLRGFRALRLKIFMRSDQAADPEIFGFADASKLDSENVKLQWHRPDLYGLLYNWLWQNPDCGDEFRALVKNTIGGRDSNSLPQNLIEKEPDQQKIFYAMAGELMGATLRKGRTYSWLHAHLSDAFGETSPRSFLIALRRAAELGPAPTDLIIDRHGLRAGVQSASTTRIGELKEDYAWIDTVLRALEGLEVPCDQDSFIGRWQQDNIGSKIDELRKGQVLGPVELEDGGAGEKGKLEASLLKALRNIGVVEKRSDNRINMPDIFRVAAKIKRRGGVSAGGYARVPGRR
ncbi:MAG TPA: hypothetical protein VKT70_08015, partial [Stellaceae bacterium]|nr:hypothetical protein [Stellaceae bacterium]